MLQCRRAILTDCCNDEEAEKAFANEYERLTQQHDPLTVDQTYDQFQADLELMDKIQKIEKLWFVGPPVASFFIRMNPEEQVTRVIRNWRDLVSLDEELAIE
jgi:hypothetical protein